MHVLHCSNLKLILSRVVCNLFIHTINNFRNHDQAAAGQDGLATGVLRDTSAAHMLPATGLPLAVAGRFWRLNWGYGATGNRRSRRLLRIAKG